MNTILSFMDKLYSDSKTLSIVYVVGAILLFIFVLLLMISLRKPDKKEEPKIIEEPKIDDDKDISITKVEEKTEEPVIKENKTIEEEKSLSGQSIFEKTKIIPLDEINKIKDTQETNIEQALNNVENYNKEEPKEEKINMNNISSEIPNVDDFVDNVVKKTYEKNEQFSSVYVGNNTSTIKLDKVMEDLNVDENVVENIVPEEEKTVEKPVEETIIEPKEEVTIEPIIEETKTVDNVSEGKTNSLDNLKKALEDKKQEVNQKQDELKAKLEGLKQENTSNPETMKAEDLLNKLNEMKKN